MTTVTDISKTTKAIKIDEEIKSLEHNIERNYVSISHVRVSTFRYFWPFFLVSLVEGLGGILFSGIDAFVRASRHEEYHSIHNIQLIVILLIFLALHIGGGIFARYMANKKNAYLEQEENSRIADIKKSEKKIIELKAQKKELLDDVSVETLLEETTEDNKSFDEALTAKVAELNKTEKIIAEHNLEIDRIRIETLTAKRTSFFYFWPFLVGSFVSYFFINSYLNVFLSDFFTAFGSDYLPMLIGIHVFILTHIFGGVFARKMRDRYNQKTDDNNVSMYETIGKLQDELVDLEIRRKKLIGELKVFEEKVPEI